MKYSIYITGVVVNGKTHSGYIDTEGNIVREDSNETFSGEALSEMLFDSEDAAWDYVNKEFIEYRYVDIRKHK